MRKITIYQEGEAIRLFDDNSSSIQDTSKELTKMMYSNNISILVTAEAAVIIRPSKINSILVENLNVEDDDEDEESLLVDPVKDIANQKLQKKPEQMDVITDVE